MLLKQLCQLRLVKQLTRIERSVILRLTVKKLVGDANLVEFDRWMLTAVELFASDHLFE